MKKTKVMGAVFLAAAFMLQVACSQVVGPNSVVATVDGKNIYRWEIDKRYEENVDIFNDANDVDLNSSQYSEDRRRYRTNLLQELIDSASAVQYAKKNGYDLTDAEKKEVDQDYEALKERNVLSFMEKDFAEDNNARDKAEKKWVQWLDENHLSEATLKENMYDQKIHEKVTAELYADIAATDEEIRKRYDEMVADQKEAFKAKPNDYAERAQKTNNGIVYNPEDFARIKYILIGIDEEANKKIKVLDGQLSQLIQDRARIAQEKGESSSAFKDTVEREKELQEEITELYTKAYADVRDEAEEVLQKVKAGEDFDELIKQYGDEPIMEEYPYNETGYLIGKNADRDSYDVRENTFKLANEGDTSELVSTEQGFVIIKLISKVQPGPITMNDDIKEFIASSIEMNPRYQTLAEYQIQARQNVTVEIFEEKI